MMKRRYTFAALAALTVGSSTFLALPSSAATVNYFWNNSSTDMNSASSYSRVDTGEVATSLPDSDDLVWFDGLPEKQPHLSQSLTLNGIRFASTNDVSKSKFYASTDDGLNGYNHCGWVLTSAEGAALTLTRGANLTQSENNQCVIASCSYGTNRVECAVQFPDAAKIMGNAGRLVLAGPISQSANGTTLIMDSSRSGGVVLAAANTNFLGILDASNCNIELAHTNAISGVKRVVLKSVTGQSNPPSYFFRNLTGGEIVDNHPFLFWMNKCQGTYFDGPPMRFSGATICPDPTESRCIWVDTSLTVGAVSNRSSATSGMLSALEYYGAGALHVLGDVGPQTIPGVTNVLRILGGTVVLHNKDVMEATPIAIGQKGTNSRRPRLGISQDLSVKSGLVPGGEVFHYENCNYGGWAAYGGDHTVTMEAATNGVLKLRGWKGDTTGLSANLSWGGSGDWWLLPGDFYFGAEDADGTITLSGDIDVNRADSNAHFTLGAFQGGAFVAGRLAGSITNSCSNFLGRRIQKNEGDGAVAIDGAVYLTGQHTVSSGGLLFNNIVTKGSVSVSGTGWLGGTGTVHAVTVQTGGALRPGEQGGTLISDDAVTFADGSKFIVDVDDKVNGCLKLTGSSKAFKANGTITVVPSLVGELTGGRIVKILDWQEASNPSNSSLFDLANWTVDADPEVFSRADLSIDGMAMYLTVRPKLKPGFFLIVR